MEGPAAVLLSCGLPLLAGVCVAAWAYDVERRVAARPSDLALATGTVAVLIAFGSVHALGWTDTLTRASTIATVLGVSLCVIVPTLALARGRRRVRAAASILAEATRELALGSIRVRSAVGLGALAVLALAAWTAWLSYLAPSSGWDGVMYHEPMVGFAFQHRGFRELGLEHANDMLTQADGYPRLMENLMLVLVAAWDRRLVDAVPSLMYPLTLLAAYAASRRFVDDRLTALGFAAGYALVPGIALQLRSTYVDVGFATFVPAAIAFVCRKDLRERDLLLGGAAIGLCAVSKVTGFIVAPLIGAVGLGVTIQRAVATRRPTLGLALLGGLTIVLLLAAPTFGRNWIEHDNPLYPGAVRVEALGIDWDGPLDISDMNHSSQQQVEWLFGPPRPDEQHHDTKDNGYGNAPPFVVLPLAAIAILVALFQGVRGPDRWRAWVLLAATVPLVAILVVSPARHWARLNLQVVFALFLLAAWLVGSRRSRLLGEGASMCLIVGGIVTLYWSEPAWDVDLDRARRLSAMSATERAVQRDQVFTLMPTETARAREAELGDGDVLVFETFPWVGLLFNERFSNRVVHVDRRGISADDWIAEAERVGATWAITRQGAPTTRRLRQHDGWEEVGPADATGSPAIAFRRRRD